LTTDVVRQARVITLFALDRACGDVPPIATAPESLVFDVVPHDGESERAETPWRPRMSMAAEHAPENYGAPHAGTAYLVRRCRTAYVHVPMAHDLIYLDIDIAADTAGIILAEKDAFDPAVTKYIAGVDLLTTVLGPGGSANFQTATAPRQLLLLRRGALPPLLGSDPTALSEDHERLLRQLVFKDVDISYRAELAPVTVPPDINGPDLQSVFVWDSNTVLEGLDGYPHLEKLRVLGFVLSNCQVLGALGRCRSIQERAVTELSRARAAEQDTAASAAQLRATTEATIRAVSSLQQDLDLGVEMHMLSAGVAGGRPLRQYHDAVVAESELPHLLRVTRHLLSQLFHSLRTDQELHSLQESRETAEKQLRIARATQGLLDQSDALRSATVVFASVAAVLSLVGLFTQAAAIPRTQQETLLHSVPGSLVFTLASVAVAAAIGFGLRFATKRMPRSDRARTWTRRLRKAAVPFMIACLAGAFTTVLSGGHPPLAITFVVLSTVGTLVVVFCIAFEFEFETPRQHHDDM
jgi:hypothetical protein